MNATEFPTRPGISAETLRAAGIRFGDTPEPGSIEIPYHDLQGNPTGFCRWRLRVRIPRCAALTRRPRRLPRRKGLWP